MNKLFSILPIIIYINIASIALQSLFAYTEAEEAEVKSFIKVGTDEGEVMKKFGYPNLTDTEKDGSEVWQYFVNPRIVSETHSKYGGFEVVFKNKKVRDLEIILAN
jgi:hypothetical protein